MASVAIRSNRSTGLVAPGEAHLPRSGSKRLWDGALILVISAVGLVVALQGWRSKAPAFDMLPYFYAVDAFVERGSILQYGNLSSYGPFFPPGTFWLMLPGRLLFGDPRLYEKLGSALLYLGTLVGVFLLARAAFGLWVARLSVLLYGLSGLGLAFAGSLWPIGNPFYFVWMAYFAVEWAVRNNARWLAAAIVIWALGMYVGMAIAPAAFVLPVIWLLRRPRIWSPWLILGGVVLLVVWFPYLSFEVGRDFADIRGLLLRQNVVPTDYRTAWCDPSLTLRWLDLSPGQTASAITSVDSTTQPSGATARIFGRLATTLQGFQSTFTESVQVPGAALVLLVASLGAMLAWGLSRGHPRAKLLVISLLVPWLIVTVLAEPGKPERFLWLWPLQAIVLASCVNYILPRARVARAVMCSMALLLVLIVDGGPVVARLGEWVRNGWGGVDAEEVQIVDLAARHVVSHGGQAAIGYELFVYPFMARYHAIDPRYKVGAEFDLLFKDRYGITNTDRCAEGLSPDDEYRIVQDVPQSDRDAPTNFFDVQRDPSFRQLGHAASYDLMAR
jgi:hypothetical protein